MSRAKRMISGSDQTGTQPSWPRINRGIALIVGSTIHIDTKAAIAALFMISLSRSSESTSRGLCRFSVQTRNKNITANKTINGPCRATNPSGIFLKTATSIAKNIIAANHSGINTRWNKAIFCVLFMILSSPAILNKDRDRVHKERCQTNYHKNHRKPCYRDCCLRPQYGEW